MASQFDVLKVIGLTPSDISVDYVNNKKQFQLHNLVTEQRHKKTWHLSELASKNTANGLAALFSVDEDISAKFSAFCEDPRLTEAVEAIKNAIKNGKRIYFYGCGATGRLAKQMESSFWRPFWKKVEEKYPGRFTQIQDLCIGEMTGGDRALISSLEGLEDLQLCGQKQLEDHGISRGDVVICVTEGGETSSVIGTILTARRQYGDMEAEESKKNLFFVFNNPETVLRGLDRSRSVLDDDGITKIPLWTGQQAVTGSTRMQATTSETYLCGIFLEQAAFEYLQEQGLTQEQLMALGFKLDSLKERILDFLEVQKAAASSKNELSKLTDMETKAYQNQGKAVYWADSAMVTVFTDSTERSPTFRLFPLDRTDAKEKKSWINCINSQEDHKTAWMEFLGRKFKGMEKSYYFEDFKNKIEDPYLRQAALNSLGNAGQDQEALYDFSSRAANVDNNGIGIVNLCLEDPLTEKHLTFLRSFSKVKNGASGLIIVTDRPRDPRLNPTSSANVLVPVVSEVFTRDPLGVRQHIALKMVLNAHSTCIMAKLGKLVGNTMTNVIPGNLKLIGRSTALMLMHVNDKLSSLAGTSVSYAQANAVLYDVVRHAQETDQEWAIAEVALAIVLILEAFRRKKAVTWEEADMALKKSGSLESYLRHFKV